GVTAETNVSFRVRALNRHGAGPYSNVFYHQISPVTIQEFQTDPSDATTTESSWSPSSEEMEENSSNELLITESAGTAPTEEEETTTTVSYDSTNEKSTKILSTEESSTDIQTSTLMNLVTTAYHSIFGEDKLEETQTEDLTSEESTTTSDFLPVTTFSTEDYYTGEYTEESDQFSIEQYHTTLNLEKNETTILWPKIRVTLPPDQIFHGGE
uniref:Fibronectin type-III domain-containing protein n=1 Tax=Romanomermis culicivorax TaxID=13658 RepID=A0A915L9D9_ROMCU